jgi:hypothetical protein
LYLCSQQPYLALAAASTWHVTTPAVLKGQNSGLTSVHPIGPPGSGGPLDAQEYGEREDVPETGFNVEGSEASANEGAEGQVQGHLQGPSEGECP